MEDKILLMLADRVGEHGMYLLLIYRVFDLVEIAFVLLLIGYGIKKAWPVFKSWMEEV